MGEVSVVGVQPAVLRWARESIGKSIEDVARALKRRSGDDIVAWENGHAAPTYAQLEKLAEAYKRPLVLFFFPAPPEEEVPEKDFRTLPHEDLLGLLPDTRVKLRQARAYQIAMHELWGNVNPTSSPIWRSVSLSPSDRINEQAHRVREVLGVTIDAQKAWRNDEDAALKNWRVCIEAIGVFVFKGTFKQKSISSFCLNDEQFPLIYINNSTPKTRQIFSLFHELGHVLLRMNGLSMVDAKYIGGLSKRDGDIEKFCNALASEVLMPRDDFEREAADVVGVEGVADEVCGRLAGLYKVSREVVLRRFLDIGLVDNKFYTSKSNEWSSVRKTASAGGGDYSLTTKTYLSEKYAREVFTRYFRNQISKEEAADYLGVKPQNIDGLETAVFEGSVCLRVREGTGAVLERIATRRDAGTSLYMADQERSGQNVS
jgi:Zn-dependent peptidase ImmA (M78 family)/transcriptional regulator with XRE-family HTH domain